MQTLLTLVPLEVRPRRAAGLDFSGQPRFAWGEEEDVERGDADDAVEVDAGPDQDAVVDGEEDEGCSGEGESELCDEPGEDIVVGFVFCGFGSVWGEEEGAEEAAGVWR